MFSFSSYIRVNYAIKVTYNDVMYEDEASDHEALTDFQAVDACVDVD
jgi:hypothetical protein